MYPEVLQEHKQNQDVHCNLSESAVEMHTHQNDQPTPDDLSVKFGNEKLNTNFS